MVTSTVLGELGGRFGNATSTLLSRDLLATVDSGDRHAAEAFFRLFRTNSFLALIYHLSRYSSDTSLMDFLLNTLEPTVMSVCGQIKQAQHTLYGSNFDLPLAGGG